MKTKIVMQVGECDIYGKEIDIPMVFPSETFFVDRYKVDAVYIDTLYEGEVVQTIICIPDTNSNKIIPDLLDIGYEKWKSMC